MCATEKDDATEHLSTVMLCITYLVLISVILTLDSSFLKLFQNLCSTCVFSYNVVCPINLFLFVFQVIIISIFMISARKLAW